MVSGNSWHYSPPFLLHSLSPFSAVWVSHGGPLVRTSWFYIDPYVRHSIQILEVMEGGRKTNVLSKWLVCGSPTCILVLGN